MDISFVIPALNEQDSLVQLCQEIQTHCPSEDYEVIFIDDGSTDQSFEVLNRLGSEDKRIKAIRFRRNFGKAAALQKGFEEASGEIVFTMDADLQDDPKEIPAFLAKMDEGYDLVSGWKQKRKDPWHKTWPSKLFNLVTALTFGLKLKDYNCGFKAYRKSLTKELSIYGEMHRYIPVLAHALGFKIGQIPVHHRARQYGKSKYGIERYLRGLFDLLTIKMVTHYNKSPLYLFGRWGLASSFVGLLIAIYLAALKIFWNMPLSNRPLLFLAMLLILGGLQFVSLGLISELIVNKFSSKAPQNISISHTINIDGDDSGIVS